MKIPKRASENQAGVGRLSTESHVGSYFCASNEDENEARNTTRSTRSFFMGPHSNNNEQQETDFPNLRPRRDMHCRCLAIVLDSRVRLRRRPNARAVRILDAYDVERSVLQHSREAALPIANSKG